MKKNKFFYYLQQIIKVKTPAFISMKMGTRLLNAKSSDDEIKRVNYYCKLSERKSMSPEATTIKDFSFRKPSSYYFDLKSLLRYFPSHYKFDYIFGDVIHIPTYPSLVKSRPISSLNQNSILLNLNKIRHFIFVNDKKPFLNKKDKLVWRGNLKKNQMARQIFLEKYSTASEINAGHTNDYEDNKWKTERLSIKEQLEYKFIMSIEGNDVATNLKWIMSSNSLCFMCKPKFETWFMEGTLVENHHYVLIKDDFSDLKDKMNYYTQNPDKASEIIKNANEYVQQFQDKKKELKIALKVLNKYFKLIS